MVLNFFMLYLKDVEFPKASFYGIENVDFKTPRALDKSLVVRLTDSAWIKKAQNVIILGPPA